MRRLLCLCIIFSALSADAQVKLRALFLGNSYTYYNNMPEMVAKMALAGGDSLIVDSWTPGGYTFGNHFSDVASLSKINAGKYDYVILQGQSQEPSLPKNMVLAQSMPAVVKLRNAIRSVNPCATIIFYETWGRKFGDFGNCPSFPDVCTYNSMQNRLRDSYRWFADTTDGIVAPVGEAFRRSVSGGAGFDLWDADQSHPSLHGSYLAAACIYEIIFRKPAVSNTFNPALPASDVFLLRKTAHSTVNDSLEKWNIGKHYAWSGFSSTPLSQSGYLFMPDVSGMQHHWDFGDGNSSSMASPVHHYSVSGSFNVKHVSFDECTRDSSFERLTAEKPSGLSESYAYVRVQVFPNPASNYIMLVPPGNVRFDGGVVTITNVAGQTLTRTPAGRRIDISSLAAGVYFVSVEGESFMAHARFIKGSE